MFYKVIVQLNNYFDIFPEVVGFYSEVEEGEEKQEEEEDEGEKEGSHGAEMGKREMTDL